MNPDDTKTPSMSRRALLAKLGIAATAAYAAPVLMKLGAARASSFSGRGRGRGRRSFSGGRFSRQGAPRRSFSRPVRARRSFSRAGRPGSFSR